MTTTHTDLDWRQHGNCTTLNDPDIMFPAPRDRNGIAAAKAICRHCPVTTDCGQWADETDQRLGIWAGLTPTERGRPANKPNRVLPARTCTQCGGTYHTARNNQQRCHTCLGTYPPPPPPPPAHVLGKADQIAALKRRKFPDEKIAAMHGWPVEAVTAARRLLGIDSRGNITQPDGSAPMNSPYRRRSTSKEV